MLAAAAFVPTPPLLVPEVAGGSAAADDDLRAACDAAVGRLLTADLDQVVVIGSAPSLDVAGGWDWGGFGVATQNPPTARLPFGVAIGAWLLDRQPTTVPRHVQGVPDLPATECARLGGILAERAPRLGLLVCGDGSACRSEKAPGYFHPEAEAWDDAAVSALGSADARALIDLDPDLAKRLLATGRAPWQVLAGAAGDGVFNAHVSYAGAPYGVMYVVGTWLR
jgi:hypothetical protein